MCVHQSVGILLGTSSIRVGKCKQISRGNDKNDNFSLTRMENKSILLPEIATSD